MYPIREDFNPACLIGMRLYQVCINANQIRLQFDSGSSIVLEGKLVLGYAYDVSESKQNLIIIAPNLLDLDLFRLIESEVTSSYLNPNRLNLSLEFSNKQMIELIGDEPYECYKIQIGNDEEILV